MATNSPSSCTDVRHAIAAKAFRCGSPLLGVGVETWSTVHYWQRYLKLLLDHNDKLFICESHEPRAEAAEFSSSFRPLLIPVALVGGAL